MFIDLQDGNKILGYDFRKTYGLLFIAYMPDKRPVETIDYDETTRAMKTTSRKDYAGIELETSEQEVNEVSGTEAESQQMSTEDSSDGGSNIYFDSFVDQKDVRPTYNDHQTESLTEYYVQ